MVVGGHVVAHQQVVRWSDVAMWWWLAGYRLLPHSCHPACLLATTYYSSTSLLVVTIAMAVGWDGGRSKTQNKHLLYVNPPHGVNVIILKTTLRVTIASWAIV
jgi:hypothetical protein